MQQLTAAAKILQGNGCNCWWRRKSSRWCPAVFDSSAGWLGCYQLAGRKWLWLYSARLSKQRHDNHDITLWLPLSSRQPFTVSGSAHRAWSGRAQSGGQLRILSERLSLGSCPLWQVCLSVLVQNLSYYCPIRLCLNIIEYHHFGPLNSSRTPHKMKHSRFKPWLLAAGTGLTFREFCYICIHNHTISYICVIFTQSHHTAIHLMIAAFSPKSALS